MQTFLQHSNRTLLQQRSNWCIVLYTSDSRTIITTALLATFISRHAVGYFCCIVQALNPPSELFEIVFGPVQNALSSDTYDLKRGRGEGGRE